MTRLASSHFPQIGDDIAPGFDMFISGKDASTSAELFEAIRPLIAEVSFEDDLDMNSVIELRLVNQPDTGPGRPVDWRAVVDSKAFQEGNFIDLFMGYGSRRAFMDRGEIVKWLPQFLEDAPGRIKIQAHDGRHRMQLSNKVKSKGVKKRKTFYKNQSDDTIVKKIAAKYGFKANTDPVEVKKKQTTLFKTVGGKLVGKKQYVIPTRVQTANQTDWKFLQRLAGINDYDLWVDFERANPSAGPQSGGQFVVHFKKKPEISSAEFVFAHNTGDGSLLSADPDFSIKDKATAVEVLMYDKKTRKIESTIIEERRKSEDVNLAGTRVGAGNMVARKSIINGASVRFTAFGRSITAIADKPFRSKKDATDFVQKFLAQNERDFLLIKGVVVGVETLRSRQIHEIIGLGARLDGFYKFTNVKHIQSPGSIYKVEFTGYKILSDRIIHKDTGVLAGTGIIIHKYNRGSRWGAKDVLQPPQVKVRKRSK